MTLRATIGTLFLFCLLPLTAAPVAADDSLSVLCGEMVTRPTDHSVTITLAFTAPAEVSVRYGITPQSLSSNTPVATAVANIPLSFSLNGLPANARTFYQVQYRTPGEPVFRSRPVRSIQTARPKGSVFRVAIEADPHLDTSTSVEMLRRTFTNIAADQPDLLIDLGDTFMSEKIPGAGVAQVTSRALLLRAQFDTLCHSVPLYLVQGNHDGELGWLVSGTADALPVVAASIRKQFYPQPEPDGFYTGDSTPAPFVGLRQNYCAWSWGDAQFILLDPYFYTGKKPQASKDNWDWTLGKEQYDWFRRTLEQSSARYIFVFAHQIVGGKDTEGRGGIEAVPFYEMGGRNADSSNGFAVHRPGWAMPVHDLMVKHHVRAFFHGHDHVFVKQDLDGIVYQELPQPGYYNTINPDRSYSNTAMAATYGYTHGTVLSSSGYLRLTITDTAATAEYVRTYLPQHENAQRINGTVAFSYSFPAQPVTAVRPASVPADWLLEQNFPNPFNPTTTIRFSLPESAPVTITIHSLLGATVKTLVDDHMSAGIHTVSMDGSGLASGVYFCRMTSGGRAWNRKMLLLR